MTYLDFTLYYLIFCLCAKGAYLLHFTYIILSSHFTLLILLSNINFTYSFELSSLVNHHAKAEKAKLYRVLGFVHLSCLFFSPVSSLHRAFHSHSSSVPRLHRVGLKRTENMTNLENMPTLGSSHQQSVSSSPTAISISGATQSNPSNPIAIDDDQQETAEGGLFETKKRKKTSAVWLEFKDVMGKDGVKRAECIHCKARLVISGGTTTHFKRHLDGCTRKKVNLKSQKMLNLIPSPVNKEVD
ncbi:uncharacterized protein LOC119982271 isoform X3 [Tripterygium wilfordii]|uniref:uncharacterized protein LOC119982271 isoform X3 n=1 Tax=Tripterygium wilfordii TaxID=458696 RepID=UPI0018F7FB3E|nr:uncharacterized protein LOC119982271 isoform X3 [Tripterygium wilfordii]